MTLIIRPAGVTDAQALADLWNPWIRDTAVTFNSVEKSQADLAEMIATRQDNGHGFFLAEDTGPPLGFATYAQFRGGIGYARAMEHTIILGPEARGQGVGRALMAALESHARSAGVHAMLAGISGENTEGRAFHAALGYADVAVIPQVGRKFGRWMDLVLMQKFLT
jgi:L-amino acid N-acyltransferase YncA